MLLNRVSKHLCGPKACNYRLTEMQVCECVHIKAMLNHMPLQTALALNPQPAGLKEKRKEEERE